MASALALVAGALRFAAASGTEVALGSVQAAASVVSIAVFVLALWPLAGATGAVLGALVLALTPAFVSVQRPAFAEPVVMALGLLALWSLARRVRAAFVLVPAALAMALFALGRVSRDAGLGRVAGMPGDWAATLRDGASTIARQLAPVPAGEPDPWLAAGATCVAMAALVWSTVRASGEVLPAAEQDDPRWPEQRALLRSAVWLAAAYVVLVVAWRVVDAALPFDVRVTAPLAPLAVAALTVVAARAWRVISRPARVFGVLALAAWLVAAGRADLAPSVRLPQADTVAPSAPPR